MLFRNLDLGPAEDPLAHDRRDVVEVLTAAIRGADAYAAVRRAVKLEEGVVRVGNRFVRKSKLREVAFLAVGNCAGAMARGFHDALGEVVTQGLVGGPEAPPEPWPFLFRKVTDPMLPTAEGATLAAEALEMAQGLGEKDLFVPLLSPGALGMLASPPSGWGLPEYHELLRSIASKPTARADLPAVAAALSPAQGGGLASAARNVPTEALLVANGEGGRTLGASPLVPADHDRGPQARAALERAGLLGRVPLALRDRLAPGAASALGGRADLHNVVIVSPGDALETAGAEAAYRKHRPRLLELHDSSLPEMAAEKLLKAIEIHAPRASRKAGEGLALFAGVGLNVPEGGQRREVLARFLATAQQGLSRREVTVALVYTGGSLREDLTPSGGMVDARQRFTLEKFRTKGLGVLDLAPGFTDVGAIALAYVTPQPSTRG
ncbi:MAG: DUF4147 domain-containing protein [Euryarchaeota archaeon]|nr:DUF4147 domain-containing protein [Euryarchaeota archaeon]MDE1836474.1 DUF4147 domain-containing protein [Euryarchaeota archaeon]MDE1880641.1 DUF4147 domain-containing protein [Euryarchaeota archaeon]MDE2044222.1 DUF4147 domain-containing protein [Thermoplasmata archaeon]